MVSNLRYITIIALTLVFFNAKSQVVLNEICSKNISILSDHENEYPDWIELYNTSDQLLNFDDIYLSDDKKNLKKFHIENLSFEPNEYILIFCSGKSGIYNGNIHTNFKISSSGEELYLSDYSGKIISQIACPELRADNSYGYNLNQSEYVFFETPTPLSENNTEQSIAYCINPVFNISSGFYKDSIELNITSNMCYSEIYYTLDGNTPTTESYKFTENFYLDSSCVICAIINRDNFLPSQTTCRTILINENKTLPVLSIITPPDNLWNPEYGIFEMGPDADTIYPFWGANFWKDTCIAIHLDYFNDVKQLSISGKFGMEMHGGRVSRTKAQKCFKIVADNKYGSSTFPYQIFADKNNNKYNTLVVRNSGGDFNKSHFRDGFIHKTIIEDSLNIDALAYSPTIIYINGKYWGLMNIREKINKNYIENNYNINIDDVDFDLLEEDTIIIDGNFDYFDQCYEYVVSNDLSQEDKFNTASNYFDLNSLADYIITETYFNNTDWPNNNIKYWRSSNTGNKWRYIIFDLDPCLNNYGWANETVDQFGTLFQVYLESNKHIQLLNSFLQNQAYKEYFINRYADLINDSFSTKIMNQRLNALVSILKPEISNHFNLWGNNIYWWEDYHIELIKDFISDRPFYARKYLQEYFDLNSQVEIRLESNIPNIDLIEVNSLSIKELPWSGIYFDEIPIQIKANNNDGLIFSHFELSDGTIIESNTINQNFYTDETIKIVYKNAFTEPIRISPNPTCYEFQLEFYLSEPKSVQYRVFNTNGALLEAIIFDNLSSGYNVININCSNLNQGVYFVELDKGTTKSHTKLIIQK